MARKATDLLDVFRFNSEGGQDGHESTSGRKTGGRAASARSGGRGARTKKRPAKSKAAASSFDGIHLSPRQLLLASSACLLLLVLSFTLGLATGRPGSVDPGTSALSRADSLVAIRATVDLVDPATRKKTDVRRIQKLLQTQFRVQPQHLRTYEEAGRLVLEVGPFRSEQQANEFRQRSGLEFAHINMTEPFRWPKIVPYRRR